MASTIDRGTLDRLIALGRERGELTAKELQAALPIGSMDVDSLVLVMLELEAAGINVEPDVFGPRADRPLPLAPKLPSASANVSPSFARAADVGPAAARGSAEMVEASGATSASGERTGVDRIVLISGLVAFLLLAFVLVLI